MSAPDAPARYLLGAPGDATAVLRRLARTGATTREGFALAESAWDVTSARLVLFGRVNDPHTAQLAVLAAARGATIVAIADTGTDLGRALLADLHRIGPVHTAAGTDPASQQTAGPTLAAGLDAAAAAEFLSLRTANRRIAEARQLLGVRTTREAVLAYMRQRDGDR